MLCRTARRMIFLYKPDELSRAEKLRLEKHLVPCSECAAEAMAARRTGQLVAGLRDQEPMLNDPEDLTAGIMRAVESERRREWSGQRRTHMPSAAVWRIQLACSLALLLIALAVVAQTSSDAGKVYALEQRLLGESGAQAARTGVPPELLRSEALSGSELLRFIQWIDHSSRGSQHTLMDYIAKNYPGLASINLDDGVDERERAILATEGETLLKELESIVRTGGISNAK